jgi:hypothetical protein
VSGLNEQMIRRAADRPAMAEAWRQAADEVAGVADVVALPNQPVRPAVAAWLDVMAMTAAIFVVTICIQGVYATGFAIARDGQGGGPPPGWAVALLVLFVVASVFGTLVVTLLLGRVGRGASTKRAIKALSRAVLATMQSLGEITTPGVRVAVVENATKAGPICVSLAGGTVREKVAFSKAITELMAPIDNPRYVVVSRRCRGRKPKDAFACPSLVGTAAKAKVFANALRRYVATYDIHYTRNPAGRKLLLECRRWSFINRNARKAEDYKIIANDPFRPHRELVGSR